MKWTQETDEWAAIDSTITITIGAGNGTPIMLQKPQNVFSAKFVNGGLLLTTSQSGKASIQVITTLGQIAKSMQSELGAGSNWIPMSELSAGKYIVRVKQGSKIQSVSIKVK